MQEDFSIYDLLDPDFLQRIQDDFAVISGVGSIIFDLKGTPITRPSNFTGYCNLIRSTKKGFENCINSDAVLSRNAKLNSGAAALVCRSGRLIDGMAPIIVEDRRIASWGIGQVILEELDEDWIRWYAGNIGVSGNELVGEYKKLNRTDEDTFLKTIKYLTTLSREVSEIALKNYRLLEEIKKRRKSEERYRSIVQNVLVGICEVSNEGNMEYANDQMTELSGYSRDELIGMNIKTILSSNRDFQSYFNGIADYSSNKSSAGLGYDFNGYICNMNRDIRIPCRVCMTPQKNLSNQVVKSSVVIIDTSAERRALSKLEERNKELFESKKQIDLFFDNSVNGLCILNQSMNRVKYNPAYMKFIRETGKIEEFQKDSVCVYFNDTILKEIMNGELEEIEVKKDYGLQLYSIRANPVRDCTGSVSQILITVEDITDYQVMMENALFAEKLTGVGMLASGIAHDLKNVFAILGNSEHTIKQLLTEGDSNLHKEKMEKSLLVQESGLISGRKLLNQLFSFSGKGTITKERFVLRDSVEMIVRIYNSRILEKNVEIVLYIRDTVIIESLESKFIQIIMNLLSNAVDAVDMNGRIVISEEVVPGELLFIMEDNGIGIAEEASDQIFKAFYSMKTDGTGLGLFSVKNIIEEFGGSIRFESEVGRGTRFIIQIKDNDQVKTWIRE
ncbi:MAG: PocR ligand-binding domain-containing protein [Spirochaetales bacterium]|nr:PocR ligand-binding domain-containing protein [Spirochaetales bacterium]